jgi:hypothetical protein
MPAELFVYVRYPEMFLGANVGLRVGEALGEVLLLVHPATQTVAVSRRATIITKKCFRILESH